MTSTSATPPPSPPAGAALVRLALSVHLTHPGLALVRAHGEVDLCTAGELRRVLTEAIEACPSVRSVICDLSGVTFLAAVGVAVLVEADDGARRHGAALRLVAATRPARRVLELCRPHGDPEVARSLSDVLAEADHQPPELAVPSVVTLSPDVLDPPAGPG